MLSAPEPILTREEILNEVIDDIGPHDPAEALEELDRRIEEQIARAAMERQRLTILTAALAAAQLLADRALQELNQAEAYARSRYPEPGKSRALYGWSLRVASARHRAYRLAMRNLADARATIERSTTG